MRAQIKTSGKYGEKKNDKQSKKRLQRLNQINTPHSIGTENQKIWNRDCGLLAMDYGSGTIRAAFGQ